MTRYCICRSKSGDGDMIACDNCDEWFHMKCIKLNAKHAKTIEKFYCDPCRQAQANLQIVYKAGHGPPAEKKTVSIKQEPLEEQKIVALKQDVKNEKTQPTSSVPKPKPRPVPTKLKPKPVPNKRKNYQRQKSKGHVRKQCANPECVYEMRQESKYCSDECGIEFNRKRYQSHFLTRWKDFSSSSEGREKRLSDIKELDRQLVEAKTYIGELKKEKEELDRTIKVIKEQATIQAKETSNQNEKKADEMEIDDEEDETVLAGDASKTYCVTCGAELLFQNTLKHWFSCHKKVEDSYNFTADVVFNVGIPDVDENPKLYCHKQDKKTKRYCMHYESACPQHSNWLSDKKEICGCPLKPSQKLIADGNYCLELKKDCTVHYHWDKFRLAEMNMRRALAFTRYDSINERIRLGEVVAKDTFGGVVGVMLHKTTDHQSQENGDRDSSPVEVM